MENPDTTTETTDKPNILFIMVDQMHYPNYEAEGFDKGIRDILGFKNMASRESNAYVDNYPGFMALRKNAVVLKNHRIATSACVPSRCAMFTGQYGTKTKSTQTDGLFKSGTDENFPWFDPKEMPTIGSYMRKAGYSSHYIGKWHISGEGTTDLENYGFSDWDLSYPDPHGTLPNNLGYYRDYQFRDLATSFLRRQGLGQPYNIAHAQQNAGIEGAEKPKETPDPWFTVCSFANPHDIASYPGLPGMVCDQRVEHQPYTLAVPDKGTISELAESGSMRLTLNKSGLDTDKVSASPSWAEDIKANNKPDCQLDYSYKMGLCLASGAGLTLAEKDKHNSKEAVSREETLASAVDYTLKTNVLGMPLVLTKDQKLASTSFMQYYAYLMSEVDQHIKSVLDALDESGQADNTIVVFCPDHGEYAGSHHMMSEKWSTGYEEVLHVPMVVRFPEKYDVKSDPSGIVLKQIEQATSHIDILPTILGLAGANVGDLMKEMTKNKEYGNLQAPVGIDLSSLIKDNDTSAIKNRDGVLFINYDTITEPVSLSRSMEQLGQGDITSFEVYLGAVEKVRANTDGLYDAEEIKFITDGPVRQPGYVHCVVDTTGWKLVRYFDLNDDSVESQYELYDLNSDITEQNNLVTYNDFPTAHKSKGRNSEDTKLIEKKAKELKKLMDKLEEKML
ncbi:MAG: sulfatase [Alteromonadaceae bacterium]|nr:MAG: sulfatase [Alteromonadaceae bacterium]